MPLFPVNIQRNRTLGWSPVKRKNPRVLSLVCAVRERYLAASLPLPTFSWRSQQPAADTDQAWQDFAAMVVEHGTIDEISNFVQQIHTAILGLAGVYIDVHFALIDSAALQAVGVKVTGATFPDDLSGAQAGLRLLQFLPQVVRAFDNDFDFAGYMPMGVALYAEWATPYKNTQGKQIAGWQVDASSTAKFGTYTMGYNDTSDFHAPLRLYLLKGTQYEYGYIPCFTTTMPEDQIVTGQTGNATSSQTFTFTVSKLTNYRYFISDKAGAPWFAAVTSFKINGHTIAQDTFNGYFEITSLLVNGSNTIVFTYDGPFGWSDLWLSRALFLTAGDSVAPSAFYEGIDCWGLNSIFDTTSSTLKPFGPPWYENAHVQINGAVNQNFTCLGTTDAPVQFPNITAAADLVEPSTEVRAEINPPPNVSTYTAYLTEPQVVPANTLPTVVATLGSGSVQYPLTHFTFTTPNVAPHTYFIAAQFDNHEVVTGVFNVITPHCGYGIGGDHILVEDNISVMDILNPSGNTFSLDGSNVV